ncbi:hypothetical protein BRADI_2g14445v3 [Brachypodium distachyon]|uniref:Uncharacterized protein n=1 Tax=Brachypodium distachyon TaxID=15368 RepID=A0A0Q3K1H0_BRADI|nr:hypothetical protein BRADI_2g14445v3 [Brachypodium distachyon]
MRRRRHQTPHNAPPPPARSQARSHRWQGRRPTFPARMRTRKAASAARTPGGRRLLPERQLAAPAAGPRPGEPKPSLGGGETAWFRRRHASWRWRRETAAASAGRSPANSLSMASTSSSPPATPSADGTPQRSSGSRRRGTSGRSSSDAAHFGGVFVTARDAKSWITCFLDLHHDSKPRCRWHLLRAAAGPAPCPFHHV